MSISDLIIIAFLILFAINGYRKGFIKTVYSMLSVVVTFFVMFLFADSLIPLITESEIGELIGKFFSGKAEDIEIINRCSSAFVYMVSYIILYFGIKLLLKLVLKVIDTLASLPLIRSLNKFLGLALGLVIGILWIILIVNVLYIFPETKDFVLSSTIADYFNIIFI